MALVLNDRVRETTTIVGTGTATLLGTVTGYQAFSVIGNGNTTYYCISDQVGPNWEVGIGAYTSAGTTLARTTVLASSNGGALVSFTAGTKDVFVTYPAETSVSGGGYPNIRPTLNLDFSNSMSVDPRITFTRASTATRVNANGLIEVVASGSPRIDFDPATDVCKGLLIEEQRTNLLTYSENFDNAVWWAKSNSTITPNATTAPDGTVTADKFVENIGSGTKQLWQGGVSYTAGTSITLSFYAKAGERNYIVFGSGTPFSFVYSGYFNLLTGVCVSNGPTVAVLSSINIGNGWYRYSITAIPTTTMTGVGFDIRPSINGIDAGSYTGDGISGIYLWGIQLEAGSFATSYIPSSDTFTSRASTATYVDSNGLIQSALTNVARYDYNPVNLALEPKLLLESASTNLLTYSEQFDNAVWTKGNTTITANTTTAPDGTVTADKLVESTTTNVYHTLGQVYSFVSGTTYTVSYFVKAAERTKIIMGFDTTVITNYEYSLFDLIAGTVTYQAGTNHTHSITRVGNGWYRCSVTATATITATALSAGFQLYTTNNNYTGDGTSGVYVWGAQLEASSFPTSYIPTVASQVTRAADISSSAQTTRVADSAVMTGTNFSSWYNQTEGAFLVNAYSPADRATSGSFRSLLQAVKYATFNSDSLFFMKNSVGQGQVAFRSNFTTDVALTSPVYGLTTIKAAGSYALNNFNYCANGYDVYTDTLGNIPVNVDRLILGAVGDNNVLGNLNGHISKLSYYPKRLTNSELQALTTG